ncbi:MAG TPA: efflux RND transporter periplasmic adaptor subunit [Casimicrobiaceae bacterium]|nr:efflux RND transporter periplasmic adaptor subunit [Casimicrobiaceae bacterium]
MPREQAEAASDDQGERSHRRAGNGEDEPTRDTDDGSAGRDDGEGEKKKSGMDPRKKRLFVAIAVAVLVLVAIGGVLWWLHARNYESTDDAYIDAHIVHVSPQISGRVSRVDVREYMRVHAGDVLVEIDRDEANARLAQAQAQEAQAQAQLAQAQADTRVRQAGYEQARAAASGAVARQNKAASDLARYRQLQKDLPSAVAGQQLDQARAALVTEKSQRDTADKQIKVALSQIDAAQTQIRAAQAGLEAAQAQVDQARINLGYTRIVASVDGTVATRNVAVGDTVSPGSQMLAIVPLDVWITANFKETQLDLIRPGQKVDIKVDAYPQVAFRGHVDSIQRGAGQAFSVLPAENATGNFVKVVQRVPVKIVFDGPLDSRYALGPGMSVVPTVHVR